MPLENGEPQLPGFLRQKQDTGASSSRHTDEIRVGDEHMPDTPPDRPPPPLIIGGCCFPDPSELGDWRDQIPRGTGFERPFHIMNLGAFFGLTLQILLFTICVIRPFFLYDPVAGQEWGISVCIGFTIFCIAGLLFKFLAESVDPRDTFHQRLDRPGQPIAASATFDPANGGLHEMTPVAPNRDGSLTTGGGSASSPLAGMTTLQIARCRNPKDKGYKCWYCDLIVSTDSRHCKACNKCIEGFDHHCKWLNTCIGKHNYFYFFGYVATIWGTVVIADAWTIYLLARVSPKMPVVDIVFASIFLTIAGIAFFMLSQLFFLHIYLQIRGITTYQHIMENRAKEEAAKMEKERQAAAAGQKA